MVVHAVGSVLALGLLLMGLGQGNLANLPKAPWYTYLGGVLSYGINYLVAPAISKARVAPATTDIILGQVFTAALWITAAGSAWSPFLSLCGRGWGFCLWQGAPGCFCLAEDRRNFTFGAEIVV